MPRRMYDSTTPWDIPRDAEMVAYYVDGRYAWPQAWLDMFPRAVKVSISAIGTRTAQVGDVEVGCIWPPANAVPWVLRARADGYDPTIYVNQRNDWGPVRQAFRAAGVPEPHYWVANYDGVAVIPAGSVAKQYAHPHDGDGVANRPWETGKHYDLSVVADYWPGVDDRGAGGGGGDDMPLNDDDKRAVEEAAYKAVRNYVFDVDAGHYPTFLNVVTKAVTAAVAPIAEAVSKLQLSGVPIKAEVDVAAVAKAVNDEDDRRDRDGDPTTGSGS